VISPSVHVLDSLSGHAGELRRSGLAAEYVRVTFEAPDLKGIEDDRIAEAPGDLSSAVLSSAAERLSSRESWSVFCPSLISAAFRFSEASDGLSWRVAGGGPGRHPGTHVAVMSLPAQGARPRPYVDSLAMWRHTPSGAVGGSEAPTEDRFRGDVWAMMGLVPLLSDRLVLVPTSSYLSIWPMASKGSGLAGGRLIWVAYVDIDAA